jgi:hypothetical protein
MVAPELLMISWWPSEGALPRKADQTRENVGSKGRGYLVFAPPQIIGAVYAMFG